jgi:uncharacterized protein YjiS (DUF1127 family)
MYGTLTATASSPVGMSDSFTAAPLAGSIVRTALASIRIRWRDYQTQLVWQQMDDRLLRDIGLQRTHEGRIAGLRS